MSNFIVIDGIEYITSNRASEMTRYSKDYIGQLSRAGKIESKKIGRVWYVSKDSLLDYKNAIESAIITQSKNTSSASYSKSSSTSRSRKSSISLASIVVAFVVIFFMSVSVYFISGSVWNLGRNGALTTTSSDVAAAHGLVVVESASSTARNAATAQAIKDSFSDEVEVKVDPRTKTGTVTPKFKSATSSEYMYVLVPVEKK